MARGHRPVRHLTVTGKVDGCEGASLDVDEERQIIVVKPKYRRDEYALPLNVVAEFIVHRVVRHRLAGAGIAVPVARGRKP